jgi:dTDP-4-dehydrorhamnose 3,5-epimerase
MTFRETDIKGLRVIEYDIREDTRGAFQKVYNEDVQRLNELTTEWSEEYFSISHKNVLRGMHFQIPPKEHDKMVTCLLGSVLDVVLDLRLDSTTYGKVKAFELNDKSKKGLYIPKGFAHGFLSLEDNSLMHYKVSSVYSPEHDSGILWSSIPFEWGISDPILSERDKQHFKLLDFNSPFRL